MYLHSTSVYKKKSNNNNEDPNLSVMVAALFNEKNLGGDFRTICVINPGHIFENSKCHLTNEHNLVQTYSSPTPECLRESI